MILLPAIDIRAGRAVRLERGDFDRETVYSQDPLAAARAWVEEGARALHVVDLDGAREGAPRNLPHLASIASELEATVQYGGGLRSKEDVARAFESGADRVVVGTAAHAGTPFLGELLEAFGDRVTVAVDIRGGRLSSSGWTEESPTSAEEAIQMLLGRGVLRFAYTNVDRDGMLGGLDTDEVRRVADAVGSSATFIYSGGIASTDDLADVAGLGLPNLTGVISGKALYEGRFTVAEGQAALDGG